MAGGAKWTRLAVFSLVGVLLLLFLGLWRFAGLGAYIQALILLSPPYNGENLNADCADSADGADLKKTSAKSAQSAPSALKINFAQNLYGGEILLNNLPRETRGESYKNVSSG